MMSLRLKFRAFSKRLTDTMARGERRTGCAQRSLLQAVRAARPIAAPLVGAWKCICRHRLVGAPDRLTPGAGTPPLEASFAGTADFLGATTAIGFSVVGPQGTPTPIVCGCPGDCDGNSRVTIDELVRGVNIALDILSLDACPCFDRNGNGRVTIDELITAVNAALDDCSA